MKMLFRHALFCITLLSVGCGQKNEQKTKTSNVQVLKINICHEPQTLDPRKVRRLNDVNISKIFMEGLTRLGKDQKINLALAEKIDVSEDLTTYTIKLKPAKWSNGDPITANDFIYSWKKTLSPSFASDYAFQLYAIKNAEAIKKGKLPTSLLGAYAVDSQTIQLTLENPTPYFLNLLAHPSFFPVHASTDKENPNWAAHPDTFVSNGPFCMEEWKHSNCMIAKKNQAYWDAKSVKLEKIEMTMVDGETGFHMFENKDLHWEGSPFSSIPINSLQTLKEKNQIHSVPMHGTYWIRTNTSHFPLNSEKLRKALALSIDRKSIVEHITAGTQTPALGIIPCSMGIRDNSLLDDGNSEEALRLFYEAMEENHLSAGKLTSLTLLYSAEDRNHLIAQAIQNQWKQVLGIHVRLEAVESKILFDRLSKSDYQLAIGSWIADFNDPVNFLEIFRSKESSTNNTNWENLTYIETLEKSYQTKDPNLRLELLKQCEQIIMNAMPVIPIFHYTLLYVKENKLQDVVLSGTGDIDFKWAYLSEKKR